MANNPRSYASQNQFWKKMAPGWARWESVVLVPRDELHRRVIELSGCRAGQTLLDFATGMGEPGLTAAGADPQLRVIGADLSEDMLAHARERAGRKQITNFETVALDSEKLPFGDRFFDGAVCCFGLEFLENVELALREIARVLKDEGRAVFCVWGKPEDNPLHTSPVVALRKFLPEEAAREPLLFRFSSVEILVRTLQDCGWNLRHSESFKGAYTYETTEDYWQARCASSPSLQSLLGTLSPDQVTKCKTALIASCRDHLDQRGRPRFAFQAELLVVTK